MKQLVMAVVLGAAFLAPGDAFAIGAVGNATKCAPTISDAVIRMPPGKPRMMAGYFSIENTCDKAIVLNKVRSASFGDSQMHQTVVSGGVARMRFLPSMTIAKGDRAVFRAGGLHLMMMKPKATIQPGQRITVRLSGPGWSRSVPFVVQSMTD